jgi:hypothetical protein
MSGQSVVFKAMCGLAGGALFMAAAVAAPVTEIDANITEEAVRAAQEAWGEALVRISRDYEEGGIEQARSTAEEVIDAAYGYEMGPVLFKPTLAVGPEPFRSTREGALAYFVGHDDTYPQDAGFALLGWREVEIENAAIFISGDLGITMGNVHITDRDGNTTTVNKTWGFQRDEAGDLRIVLHHSSLPVLD